LPFAFFHAKSKFQKNLFMDKNKSKLTSLAEVLQNAMPKLARGNIGKTISIHDKWPEIVGPLIATRSRILFMKSDCLVIGVQNSTWLNELSLQKKNILSQIQQQFPELSLKDIKLKIE
jgi:hypothetical protein